MKYIKQLNSLRAIAVILVIASHWLAATHILNTLPLGQMGVDIFFVLSGFLITSILLQNKELAEQEQLSKVKVLKVFYWRRTLRIFPIYYLTITILYLIGENTGTDIRSSIGYFLTYTSNFYFFNISAWDGLLSHLWSLAVEEQFYLFWPFLMLYINSKYLRPMIFIFIAVGIGSQYLLQDVPMNRILTITCFDGFGLGALLAWQIRYRSISKLYMVLSVACMVAVAVFCFGVYQKQWTFIPLRTLISIISLWIILYIYRYESSDQLRFKFILNNKVLIFLGKISYGLYLYHNMIPVFHNRFLIGYLGINIPGYFGSYEGKIFQLENICLLIGISWLSFVLIENPFLKMKSKFDHLLAKPAKASDNQIIPATIH
ncbi:acyltransferase family protein [Pedobacter metabolipauper]|uniref:Peptidoglycan/LPS O-acetylase OafA/YrhL n=1 Tax=Pedobacter metabolipauper TaxID=425513 RepID=A0A4R6SZU6_9SPHI|nr:acyltransferase [Pedobacter metabolipauper]TDQ11996.1 peptidoglycan/LPS O-acetylase OafA/YrhL [Pedobacter metabolipauper]